MAIPKYKELENITTLVDLEKEIFLFTKNLFDLRMKKSTNQSVKPHLFVHTKRRLAQLKFKKLSLLKENS